MTRGVRLYLVGSFVLVSLAGCGRGFFQSAEREPWRAEAEVACLKSGAVKESPELVRIDPISGPGVCGAQFPLKVAALGEGSGSFGFADELRPPGQHRQPAALADRSRRRPRAAPQTYSDTRAAPAELRRAVQRADLADARRASPPRKMKSICRPKARRNCATRAAADPIRQHQPIRRASATRHPRRAPYSAPYPERPEASQPLPRLGPARGDPVNAVGPVAVKPTATLACPIVSVLDRWLADSVQPAAMRWFGVRVVEIKQISAYSCRGMNGNPSAHISEHAFGNALDIAAFTLADGRRITVKGGWRGMPEEQGFLRDVQASACQQFNTVLAPGSNVYHEDHIHVDLMRRASGRADLPAGRGVRRGGRGAGRPGAIPTRRASPMHGFARAAEPSHRPTEQRSTRKTSSRTT